MPTFSAMDLFKRRVEKILASSSEITDIKKRLDETEPQIPSTTTLEARIVALELVIDGLKIKVDKLEKGDK